MSSSRMSFQFPKAKVLNDDVDDNFIDDFVMKVLAEDDSKHSFVFEDDRPEPNVPVESPSRVIKFKDPRDEPELFQTEESEENDIDDVIKHMMEESGEEDKGSDSSDETEYVERFVPFNEVRFNVTSDIQKSCSKIANLIRDYLYENLLKGFNITLLAGPNGQQPEIQTIIGNAVYNSFRDVMKFERDKVSGVINWPSKNLIETELAAFYKFFDVVYHDTDISSDDIIDMMDRFINKYGPTALLPMDPIKNALQNRLNGKAPFLNEDQKEEILASVIAILGLTPDHRDSILDDNYLEKIVKNEQGCSDPDCDCGDDKTAKLFAAMRDIACDDIDSFKNHIDSYLKEEMSDMVQQALENKPVDGNNSQALMEELESEDEEDTFDMNCIYLSDTPDDSCISIAHNGVVSTYYVSPNDEADYTRYLTKDNNFNRYAFLSMYVPWFYLDVPELKKVIEYFSTGDRKGMSHQIIIMKLQENYGVYWLYEDMLQFIEDNYKTGIFVKIFNDLRDLDIVSKFDISVDGKEADTLYADTACQYLDCFCINDADLNPIHDQIFRFSVPQYMLDEDSDSTNEDDEDDLNPNYTEADPQEVEVVITEDISNVDEILKPFLREE